MSGLDITGRQYGGLTAVSPTSERHFNSVVWLWRCDCGGEVRLRDRQAKNHISCGCVRRPPAPPVDLIGHRYGKLTVAALDEAFVGDGVGWACRCDCGGQTTVKTRDLRSGNTKSCGCLRHAPRQGLDGSSSAIKPGETYGLLTVEYELCREGGQRYLWCSCECGGGATVRAGLLRAGQTRSCGCLRAKSGPLRAERRGREIDKAGPMYEGLRATREERLAVLRAKAAA